jgi:S-formylglutathione hydrolase FrmB
MKRVFTLCLVLLMLAGTFSTTAQKSRYVEVKMKSEVLGVEKDLAVYLPAGYDESGKSYPVLYLLHGAGGYYKTWLEKGNMKQIADRVIAGGMTLPMIIVMPDARGNGLPKSKYGGENMGYYNLEGWRYEDYFTDELIPFIEANYRVKADKQHRAIAGLSMGGGGAVILSQHNPHLFSSCCSLSGRLGMSEQERDERLSQTDRYAASYTNSIYEHQPNRFFGRASKAQLAALKSVRWYVDCGDDDYLAPGNVEFWEIMQKYGIPLQYRMRDGKHNWMYWQSALPTVLTYVSIGFAR